MQSFRINMTGAQDFKPHVNHCRWCRLFFFFFCFGWIFVWNTALLFKLLGRMWTFCFLFVVLSSFLLGFLSFFIWRLIKKNLQLHNNVLLSLFCLFYVDIIFIVESTACAYELQFFFLHTTRSWLNIKIEDAFLSRNAGHIVCQIQQIFV